MKKAFALLLSMLMMAGGLTACKGDPGVSSPVSGSAVSDSSGTSSGTPGGDSSGSPDDPDNPDVSGTPSTPGNPDNPDTPDTPNNPSAKNPLEGVNLGGATIEIYTHSAEGIFNRKTGTTLYGDACAERLSELEDKLNCKVNITVKTVDEMQLLAFNTIASGKAFAHIIEVPVYKSFSYIASDLVTDLKTVSTVDLTQSYLNAGDVVNASTLGRGTWFVGTEDMYATTVMGYFFNKRILEECRLENPYDLVKNNQWTIQKLRDMAKAATQDKDGRPGMSTADQYGILQTSYSADATEALLAAVNAQMLKSDGKGGVIYNMDSSEVINAINLSNQVFVKDGTAYATSSNDEELYNLFMSGHGLFLGTTASTAKYIMDMDDDFGFVPFPRGDSASSISGATNWNSSTLMIPAGLSDTELANAGSFLQAFCYLASDTADVMYDEYSARYFRDDESSEMLDMMANNNKLAIATILGSTANWTIHEGTYKVLYYCVPGDQSAEQLVQETKSATVAALEEQMEQIR